MAREQPVKSARSLAVRLRQWMSREAVSTAGSPGIYSVEQFRAAIRREQARAERNGHQITLALVPANSHNGDARRTSRLVDILRDRIRVMDEAGWFDPSRIGVLMPYTSCRGAWHMIESLCELMDGDLAASDCSVYTYPHEWLDGDGQWQEHDAADVCPAKRLQGPAGGSLFAPILCKSGRSSAGATARATSDKVFAGLACVYPLMSVPWSDPSVLERGLDIACSLLGLTIAAPLFLGAALMIKLVSPGPVFFKQVRIGRGGKPFLLWKFRTMTANADTSVHQNHMTQLIKSAAENGQASSRPMTKLDNDPRVIPLGRILRGTCIDELPQLINVLRGEMSLVGPRPPIPYEVRDYEPWQRRRLDSVPGLTGLWQVSGKNKLTFEEMVRLDIQYSRRRSFGMNIMIMLRTPRVILEEITGVWVRWKERTPEDA
jgi:lipopolysaccharide/colanic/teichoic acid biosynthesis glycosyltransferase